MNPKRLCARVRRDCGVVLSTQFGKEALEEAARSRLSGDSALVDFVLQRWLDTDVAVTSPVAVLPGKEETARLDHAVVVQVDAVVDVSRGAYDQLVECRRMRDRSEQWERSKHGGAAVESSKRVLKLKLTDGINAVIGFEVETIPWLRKHTMPGSKIRLLPGTEIKEGLVLLNPRLCEDVKQRAASPEEEARHYENLLKRLLGIDIDDDEEEHEGEAMAVDPPPLQNHARVDDDSGDDIDDSLLAGIDMDTIANPAMNEPTQPSAYPTPDGAAVIRHVDKRPRLDTANPDPATQQESLPQRWTSGGSSVATAHSTIKQERKVVRQDAPLVSKVQQQAVEAGPAVDTEPVSKLQSPPKQTKRKQPVPLNQLATALRSGSTQVQVEGRVKSFAGGLTKAEGEWRLDVDFESAGQITRLYMGNTLLTDKLGMSVEEFTQRKRAGKKDAAKKAELAEHFAAAQSQFQMDLMKATRFWLRAGDADIAEVMRIE